MKARILNVNEKLKNKNNIIKLKKKSKKEK